jgi:hypothetical protein
MQSLTAASTLVPLVRIPVARGLKLELPFPCFNIVINAAVASGNDIGGGDWELAMSRHGSVAKLEVTCEVAASLDIPAVTFIKGPGFFQLLCVVEFNYPVPDSQEIQPAKRHLRGENAVSGTAGQDNLDSTDTKSYFTSLSNTSTT